tara:strand:- start:4 stop:2169 length:2166 start_codon:yes stop_codon:yes gene_type:complete
MLVQPGFGGTRQGYNGRGGPRKNTGGDRSQYIDYEARIKNPGKKFLDIAEKVHGNKPEYKNLKGFELWKKLKTSERSNIKQGSTTGETGGIGKLKKNQIGKDEFIKLVNVNKDKTYNQFVEILKDYKTKDNKPFTNSIVSDRLRQYDLSGSFKKEPPKGNDPTVKAAAERKRQASLKESDPTKAKGTKKFNYHHITQIEGGIPITSDDVLIINQRINSQLGGETNKALNRISAAIRKNNKLALEAMNNKQEGLALDYMKRSDELNAQAEKIVNSAIDKLPKKYKGYVGFKQFTLPRDEYGLPIGNEPMIIKKIGNTQVSKNAIDLTTLTKKGEAEFRKIVKAQAERGEVGPIKIQKLLASFGDGTCAVQFGKGNKDGGRIGYATGPASLNDCIKSGARNFNDGKFKTADQVKDAAKLLRGGRAVVSGLMKYGIVPELAYVGLEAAGRTLLGEKPTNALLKSIDTLTFGATDFTSGIEADKFGKDADRKLAVDKFRNSQALVNSLQNKLENLRSITDQGGEGYVGDLSSDIQMTQAQLQAAEQELQKNTVSPDLVQFIDRRGQEIADTQMAKSNFAKQSLRDQMEGIPGIRDYTDTESTRIFPAQPSQMDLNLNMFPTLPTDFMQLKTSDAINLAQAYRKQGENVSAKDILAYRDELKSTPLSELAKTYGDEQIYGTQGAEALQPLAGGGIAKLAGVSSGPPPERGPNSQGLQGLMKRVRNL